MKINKIHFENHPFFGTLDIDFSSPDGNGTLNTIVIAGINGSGKTTLLNAIVAIISTSGREVEKNYALVDIKGFSEKYPKLWDESDISRFSPDDKDIKNINHGLIKFSKDIGVDFLLTRKFEVLEISERPRIVYMPSEINFSDINIQTTPYAYKYSFFNIINEKITRDVPNFFATYIDRYVYSRNLLPAESIKLACEEINSLFKELEMESWIIGLKKDGSRMPIFQNKLGKTFDITGLSSGEMQLFFRIISLKMMDINNSIILVDEPEISLHPSWQQRILKVYENIGENNQVIAATHSPHVISSVPKESLKLLVVEPPGIYVVDHRDLRNSYGASIKRVLKDIMLLKSDRDPQIQAKIDDLKNILNQDNYDQFPSVVDFFRMECLDIWSEIHSLIQPSNS